MVRQGTEPNRKGTGAKGGYVIGRDSIPDGVLFTGTGSVEGVLKVRIDDGGIWAVKFGGTAVMLR